MDIQQEWDNLNAEMNSTVKEDKTDYSIIQKESTGLYETLIKHLKYKLRYVIGFGILVLIPVFFTDGALRIVLIISSLVYILGALDLWAKIKRLPAQTDYSTLTRQMIAQRIFLVNKILQLENKGAYILMPFAPFAGFLIFKLKINNDISTVFSNNNWFYLVPLFIVIGLLGAHMGSKMNIIAFGKHLDQLNDISRDLEG